MYFYNQLGYAPSRSTFKGPQGIVIDDYLNVDDPVEIAYSGDVIEVVPEGTIKARKEPSHSDVPRGILAPALVAGADKGVFEWGEDIDKSEDLIWVLADSLSIPVGREVTLSYILFDPAEDDDEDEYPVLVCLKEGAIKVVVGDEELVLSRGVNWDLDSLAFSYSGFRKALPVSGQYRDALVTATLKIEVKTVKKNKKVQYTTPTATSRLIKENTFLLDEGFYQSEAERIAAEQEEAELLKEERRKAQEEEAAERLAKRAQSEAKKSTKGHRTPAATSSGRNALAEMFLSQNTNK